MFIKALFIVIEEQLFVYVAAVMVFVDCLNTDVAPAPTLAFSFSDSCKACALLFKQCFVPVV